MSCTAIGHPHSNNPPCQAAQLWCSPAPIVTTPGKLIPMQEDAQASAQHAAARDEEMQEAMQQAQQAPIQQDCPQEQQQQQQQQSPQPQQQSVQPQQQHNQQHQRQQQQQQQQADIDGSSQGAQQAQPKHSKQQHKEEQGPNVEGWWLSESESEGDGDERRMAAQSEDQLYDPEADAADEAWAVQQRSGRTTDAILSCPCCFTTLCIDCQQHELYHTQYRAMFTQNCEVKLDEVVQVQQQQQRGGSRKRRADAAAAVPPDEAQADPQDVMHPVCCAVCGERVGAQDSDEVVHFYQVLASEC